jgi:hypothetical protein
MKRILLTAAACAAALLGTAAMAAPAMAAPAARTAPAAASSPVTISLQAGCTLPVADYGRGIALGGWANGYRQITLSTRNKVTLRWTYIQNDHGPFTFYLKYGTHYVRVNKTHAWLGTSRQVFAVYDGYGDACGDGPEFIHLGVTADGSGGPNVWMAKGRTLVSAPKVQASPADPTPAGLAAQLWGTSTFPNG